MDFALNNPRRFVCHLITNKQKHNNIYEKLKKYQKVGDCNKKKTGGYKNSYKLLYYEGVLHKFNRISKLIKFSLSDDGSYLPSLKAKS